MTQIVNTYYNITGQELKDMLKQLITDGHSIISVCSIGDWSWFRYDKTKDANTYTNNYLVVYIFKK